MPPNTSIPPSQTLLLLIDIQRGFFAHPAYFGTGSLSTPNFAPNISTLLSNFRSAGTKVIHVAHHSKDPASPLYPDHDDGDKAAETKEALEFASYAQPLPDEPVVVKRVNSAFIGTDLEARIRGLGIRRLVIAGLTTGHCVSTSVRMAGNLGVVNAAQSEEGQIILVSDACAMFELRDKSTGGLIVDAETAHRVNLETVRGEFCEVLRTEEVIGLFNEGRT